MRGKREEGNSITRRQDNSGQFTYSQIQKIMSKLRDADQKGFVNLSTTPLSDYSIDELIELKKKDADKELELMKVLNDPSTYEQTPKTRETPFAKEYYIEVLDKTLLHRVDGPAVVGRNSEKYIQKGLLHRVDGPAVVYPGGTQEWWQEGSRYRENDLPCVERADGPNETREGGTKEWMKDNLHHRENGPAIIWADGKEEWFTNGVIQKTENKKDGLQILYKDGKMHNESGPAYVDEKKQVEKYYIEGCLHRENGPAVVNKLQGMEEYWVEGKRHNAKGPAVQTRKKTKYFLEGEEYSEKDWEEKRKEYL